MCIIVLWSSPNIILFWEALVTFLMMPVLTVLVYMADKGYFDRKSKIAPEGEGGAEGAGQGKLSSLRAKCLFLWSF